MKNLSLFIALLTLFACQKKEEIPEPQHVILIGLDGFGAKALQLAETPQFNKMIANGAVSVTTRSVRPTSSGPNWTSMLTATIPLHHGVTNNNWSKESYTIAPSLKNNVGAFPSIFDFIRQQQPNAKAYMFYEWGGMAKTLDMDMPHKVVLRDNAEQLYDEAVETFFADRPEFLFLAIDETDGFGHSYGWNTKGYLDGISKWDTKIGEFVDRLQSANLMENTVIIITGDHGGRGTGHGGDTPDEMEIPVIIYGKGVTPGKLIDQTHVISDIPATIAALLGIELPGECTGKAIQQAFEPLSSHQYTPIPAFSKPDNTFYSQPIDVSLFADFPETEIYYTTDGTDPSQQSNLYTEPVTVSEKTIIKATTFKGKNQSQIVQANYRVLSPDAVPGISYKLFYNYNGLVVPNFSRMRQPDASGKIYEFSLHELSDLINIEKDGEIQNQDHIAIQFSSTIVIEEEGEYIFHLTSDDGSNLFINNNMIIDNDGSHSVTTKTGKIDLKPGKYPIRIDYFEDYGGESLKLEFQSETLPKQVVSFSYLE
jgi:hypothetical protein